jgi:toxin CcdB
MACLWPSTAPSRVVWATEKNRLEMARFDVYPNPDPDDRAEIPYLLDIQNTFIEVETRVVVPLSTANLFKGMVRDLNPQVVVQGKKVILNTSALGAIPASDLRRPIANLASDQALIQGALDTLLGGY